MCLLVLLLLSEPVQPHTSWLKIPHVSFPPPLQTKALSILTKLTNIDGVAVLFLWGEVEEWIVLITMCIPPVWPLFRPFAQRFIENATSRSRSRPQQYALDNRTDKDGSSSRMWPPRVTTTISVSSFNEAIPTTVPSGKSSDSMMKHADRGGGRDMQEAWMELPDYEEKSILHSHHPRR